MIFGTHLKSFLYIRHFICFRTPFLSWCEFGSKSSGFVKFRTIQSLSVNLGFLDLAFFHQIWAIFRTHWLGSCLVSLDFVLLIIFFNRIVRQHNCAPPHYSSDFLTLQKFDHELQENTIFSRDGREGESSIFLPPTCFVLMLLQHH